MSDDWVQTTLADLVDLQIGPAFKSEIFREATEGPRLLRGINVGPDGTRWKETFLWPQAELAAFEKYLLSASDICVAMDATFTSVGQIRAVSIQKSDLPCLLVQRVARIRTKDDISLLQGFLWLLIRSDGFRSHLTDRQTGAFAPHISGRDIGSFTVSLPPLSVQRRIVDLMTHLDNHIENLYIERDTARAVRKTTFENLLDGALGIPVSYDGVFRLAEPTQHALNSDDWTDTTLGDIAEWRGGMTPSMSNAAYWNGGDIPWISSKEVVGGVIVATQKRITSLAIEETSLRLLPPGVVVVVVRSGILLHTFPVAFVPFESTVNQDVKSAAPFESVDGRFLAHLIESNGQEILQRYRKTGTTVQSVDVPGLMSYRVSLPPLPVQHRILDLITHLDTYISDLDFEVSTLEGVRQQVLASLLSGAIEVPDSYDSLLSKAS